MNRFVLIGLASSMFISFAASAQNLSDRIRHVAEQQRRAQVNNNTKAELLGALLYTDLSVELTETPAREAMNWLQTSIGVNIIGRYNDDRTGLGLDPEAPITLNVTNKPALSILEMILDQCADDLDETTWQLREGFIEVGTKERLGAKSAQAIRYYPIRDLLYEVPRFDNAPDLDLDNALQQSNNRGGGGFGGGGGGFGGGGGGGGGGRGGGSIFDDPGDDPDRVSEEEKVDQIISLITEIVEPDGWEDNGGDWATIRYYQGTLIVRAPDFMHRQIDGYPFSGRSAASVNYVGGPRYVTFTGGISNVEITELKNSAPIGGAAGGTP